MVLLVMGIGDTETVAVEGLNVPTGGEWSLRCSGRKWSLGPVWRQTVQMWKMHEPEVWMAYGKQFTDNSPGVYQQEEWLWKRLALADRVVKMKGTKTECPWCMVLGTRSNLPPCPNMCGTTRMPMLSARMQQTISF